MAAFTHRNPEGSRFSDGSFGVYYAAKTIETAIAETGHHRARFLARTNEPPMEFDMRAYLASLSGTLHDIRGRKNLSAIYDPRDYRAGQALGVELRRSGSNGIAYDSVRDPGGECAAVFRPPLLSNCIQGPHYGYVWDGTKISTVYEKKLVSTGRADRA